MSKTANRKPKRKSPAGEPSLIRSVLFGLAVCGVGALILLFIFSAIVYSTPDPGSLALPASLALLYIAAFAGGLAAAWKNRGDAVACGLLSGGCFCLLLILLSFIFPKNDIPLGFWPSAGLHLLSVVFALLGGAAGVSLRRSGSQRRRHRR